MLSSLKILVIDNFDSFTYNLVALLRAALEPSLGTIITIRNDQRDLLELDFDGLIIAPGPGNPNDAAATGYAAPLFKRCLEDYHKQARQVAPYEKKPWFPPTLGVCLGHQAISLWVGGKVMRAARPIHGHAEAIFHRGEGPLLGLPSPFQAARYHSLVVEPTSLPVCLEPLAFSRAGELMAFQHRSLPIWGVQFHPESFLTSHGEQIVSNFLQLLNLHRRLRTPIASCS